MSRCCNNCSEPFTERHQKNFCSLLCQGEYRRKIRIEAWLKGEWNGSRPSGEMSRTVKEYLLAKAEGKCSKCGWDKKNPSTGRTPLEVDHIDGNWENNSPSNLQVLCPNCHSLTPNYKALNVGKGRTWRSNYSQFEKQPKKEKILNLNKVCGCGKPKQIRSKVCQDCFQKSERTRIDSTYPTIDEVVSGVEELGYKAFGNSIGVSDSGVRKHLNKHGIDPKTVKKLTKAEKAVQEQSI